MNKTTNMNLERFEEILEAYGADQSRWPESSREGAVRLVAQNAVARKLHGEHVALEKVLDASRGMVAGQALKDRILATAIHDGEKEARVVPIGAARRSVPGSGMLRTGSIWPAAALAASFALGLYLGVVGLGDEAYQEAVQVSGLSVDVSDGDRSSWLDIGAGSGSEGIL